MLHNIYYIVMGNCKHRIINYEQEYICNKCGRVFSIEEAIELDAYNNEDTKGVIDIKGKTNPWLLGLGSLIDKRSKEGRRLVKIAKDNNIYEQEYSLLSNIIVYLRLENYTQEIFNRFKVYSKSKNDYAIASYLAISIINYTYNLKINESKIREAVKMYFKRDVKSISRYATNYVSNMAVLTSANEAIDIFNRAIKRW